LNDESLKAKEGIPNKKIVVRAAPYEKRAELGNLLAF
jgi:hypothetical protein